MFLLILTFLSLPIGFAVGWFVRRRRAVLELTQQRVQHADLQLQLTETRNAFEANERELEALSVDRQFEARLEANGLQVSHLAAVKQPLRNQKLLNGKLVKVQQSVASRKYYSQGMQSEQLKISYGTFGSQSVANSDSATNLDSTLTHTVSLEQERKAANEDVNALQLGNTTTEQTEIVEIHSLNKQHEHPKTRLKNEIRKLRQNNTELNKNIAQQEQAFPKSQNESSNNEDNEVAHSEFDKSERQQLLLKIDELKGAVASAEKDKERILVLEADLQKAEKSKHSTEGKISLLQSDIQTLTEYKENSEEKESEQGNQVVNLEETIDSLEEKNQAYQEQLDQFKTNLIARDDQILDLRDENERKENKVKQLRKELGSRRASDKKTFSSHEEQKKSLSEKLEISNSKVEMLTKDVERLEPFESELELFKKEKQELAGKLDETTDENQALLNRVEVAEGKLKILGNQFGLDEARKQKINEQMSKLQKDNEAIPELLAAASASENRLNEANNEISDLRLELSNLQKDNKLIPQLQAATSNSEKQLNEATNEISSLNLQLSGFQKDRETLSALQADALESETKLEATTFELNSLHTELTGLRRDNKVIPELQASATESATKLKNADQEISRLNVELNSLRKNNSAIPGLEDTAAEAKAKLKDATHQIINLENKLSEQLADQRQLQDKVDQRNSAIEKLQAEHSKLEKLPAALVDMEAKLKAANTSNTGQKEQLKNQQELQDALKDQENALSDMRKRVASFHDLKLELAEAKKSQERFRETASDIQALRQQVKKMELKNRELIEEIDNLSSIEKQLARVRFNHKELKAVHKNMSLELESVKKENAFNKRRATILTQQANAPKLSVTKKTSQRAKPQRAADDLKQIHGIGPVLEKLLHKNGITRFEQLAKLDKKGVQDLSSKLGSFSNRIKKDGWVKSATKLAKNR